MILAMPAFIDELCTLAARHRAEGDNLRRLPPALAEAFLRHDIYRLILPRDLGGAEASQLDWSHFSHARSLLRHSRRR